jgi:hypothetical protein
MVPSYRRTRPQLQYLEALMITITHNEHVQHLFNEKYKPTIEHKSKYHLTRHSTIRGGERSHQDPLRLSV